MQEGYRRWKERGGGVGMEWEAGKKKTQAREKRKEDVVDRRKDEEEKTKRKEKSKVEATSANDTYPHALLNKTPT